MKVLDIESNDHTTIYVADEPGQDGAYHKYHIYSTDKDASEITEVFSDVQFQNGSIKESGVNGCQQEDLIAICIHRLQCFQSSDFKCRENALAITKLEEALHWLKHRTEDRIKRGVEGTNEL